MMQTYEDGFFSAQIINARCIERGVGHWYWDYLQNLLIGKCFDEMFI